MACRRNLKEIRNHLEWNEKEKENATYQNLWISVKVMFREKIHSIENIY